MRITLMLLCFTTLLLNVEAQSKKRQIIALTTKLDSVTTSSDSLFSLLVQERMRADSLENQLRDANRSIRKNSRELKDLSKRLEELEEAEEQEKRFSSMGPIRLYDAKVLMLEESKVRNESIEEYKTQMIDGEIYYLFLTKTKDSQYCISRISEYEAKIEDMSCGVYDVKYSEWRTL